MGDRRSLPMLEQIVPSRTCLSCNVCCRFPSADAFLRPYFTAEEIERAIAHGVAAAHFPDPAGCQVDLVPDPAGIGYCCPAFDPRSGTCRIYEVRPLDCQLYPLAVMWSEDGREVVLGWDPLCPFVAGRFDDDEGERIGVGVAVPAALREHAERLAPRLEDEAAIERYRRHPGLVGRYQPDVRVVRSLERLSARLRGGQTGLRRVTVEDRARVDAAAAVARARWGTSLGCYSFAAQFVWHDLLPLSLMELAGHLCLFAESPDGLFMPLPPLGEGPGADRIAAAAAAAFEVMDRRNGARPVSRIESVPEAMAGVLQEAGYRLRPKEPDYLYRTADLVALAGDRYKSPRHACNRFQHRARVEPFAGRHRDECLALFRRWVRQQEAREDLGEAGRYLLADAASAHAAGLAHAEALGLGGLIVRVDGALCGYTLGCPLPTVTGTCGHPGPPEPTFCILFEITDRSLPGLGAFLFRELCRQAAQRGFSLINTMDDAALPGLRRSKQAYRPMRLIGSYIATKA